MRRGSNSHDRIGPNEELISRENNALCEENKVTEDVAPFQRCPSKDNTNASEVIKTCGEDELRDGTLSCEVDISNASEIRASESKECMSTVQSKKQFIHLPLDKQTSSETLHLQASTEENTDCAILGNLIASKNEKCVSADTLDTKHCLISPSRGRSFTEEESAHYSSSSCGPTVAGTTASFSPCTLLNDPENRLRSAGSKNGGSSTASRGVEPEHRLIMRTSSVEILRRVKLENSSEKSRVFVIQPSFKQVVNPVPDQSKTEDILVLIREKAAPNQDLSDNSFEENQQDDPGKNVSPEVKCTSTSRSKPGSERNVLQQNRCAEIQCNLSSGYERSSSSREDVDGCDEWSQEGSIELNESSNYLESLQVDGTLQMPNRRKASQKDLNKRCVKIQCNLPQSCPSSQPTRQLEARSKSCSPTKNTTEHDLSSSRFFKAFPASSDVGKSQMTENVSNLLEGESVASSTQIIIEEKILVRSTNNMNDIMTVKDDKCTLSTNILSNIRDLLIGTFSDSSSMHEDSCERPLVDSNLPSTVPCPNQNVGDDSIPQKSKKQNQLFELEEQPSMVASECECSSQSDREHCHGLGLLVKQSEPPTTISDRRKNSSSPKKSRSMFDVINVNHDSIFKIHMSECKSNDSRASEDAAVCLDERWIGSYKDDNDAQTHENTISQKSRSAIISRSLPELNRSKDRGYIAERTQSRTLECREKGSTRPQGSNEIDVNFAPVFLQEAGRRRTRFSSISSEDVSGQAFCLYTLSAVDMGVGRRSRSVDASPQKENSHIQHSGKSFPPWMKEGSCSGSEVGSELCFENDPGALTGESSHFDPHPCHEHRTEFRSESCSCSPWGKTTPNLCIHNSSHTQPCSKKSSCPGCGQESNSCNDNRFLLRFINESFTPSEIESHLCINNHLEDESYPCREGCSCVPNQDDCQSCTVPCSEDGSPLRSRSGKEDLSHSCLELCLDKLESLPKSNGPSQFNPAERIECYPSSKQIDVEIGHRALMSTEVVCYGHPNPYTSSNSIAKSTFVFTMAIASIVTFFVGMLFWRVHSER